MNRRDFLRLTAGAASVLGTFKLARAQNAVGDLSPVRNLPGARLETFEYRGVRLLPGPFADRLAATRAYYFSLPNDDIVKGFREMANLPAPGTNLGGWCSKTSAIVFGQWLSGMARIYRATADDDMRTKAVDLMKAWGETLPSQKFHHYGYDKFVCGLVDLAEYAHCPEALPLLAKMTDWAENNMRRDRLNATDVDSTGGFFNGQGEWYTLSENLYRAYLLTGEVRYKNFAKVWHYENYWGMFNGRTSDTPDGFHAYSHVNTLSSAAMAYAVTGDGAYLQTITNAYDYFQKTQCYATGGYGPGEKLMRPNGELGNSIVIEPNEKYLGKVKGKSFETPCGTWAVFKLVRYLQQFTGEARYSDWTERVLYNGIGAALPMAGRGETFYYADYRLNNARKNYFGAAFPCCSGTYLQDVADIHNIIYLKDSSGLFVNLYVPSEVTWDQGGQSIKLTQTTRYPTEETINFVLNLDRPSTFNIRFRVPEWATNVSMTQNAAVVSGLRAKPGQWLELNRLWQNGDTFTLRIPLSPRQVAIDEAHPQRVAWVRGPVVLVRPLDKGPTNNAETPVGMVPFAEMKKHAPYLMYSDV